MADLRGCWVYNFIEQRVQWCDARQRKVYDSRSYVPDETWQTPFVYRGKPIVTAPSIDKRVKPRFA
jgi:hypothetical protein